MPRVSDTAPPRILDVTEIVPLDEGHNVAVLVLETDDGEVEFGVNRAIAAELISVLAYFLGGPSPEDDEDETPRTDG